MSLKKILICFVVIIITFCLCVSASEDNAYLRINDVNNETGVVTLSGNIGADKVRNIFLIVSETVSKCAEERKLPNSFLDCHHHDTKTRQNYPTKRRKSHANDW